MGCDIIIIKPSFIANGFKNHTTQNCINSKQFCCLRQNFELYHSGLSSSEIGCVQVLPQQTPWLRETFSPPTHTCCSGIRTAKHQRKSNSTHSDLSCCQDNSSTAPACFILVCLYQLELGSLTPPHLPLTSLSLKGLKWSVPSRNTMYSKPASDKSCAQTVPVYSPSPPQKRYRATLWWYRHLS